MQIVEVTSRRQLRQFVRFPDELYRGCPQYVPALHSDQYKSLTKYPALKYCTRKMFLALDDKGRVAGRIQAVVNPRYNEYYGKKCCRFGYFDVVNDYDIAKALVSAASAWAKSQGMTQIHGPLFYNTLGKQGMVVEGFDSLPQFNNLYNYAYYPEFLERMGFVKECDWVQVRVEDKSLPQKMRDISSRLMQRYKLHYGSV